MPKNQKQHRIKKDKYKVVRKITEKECPWIPGFIPVGTILYGYYGPTYGPINGIPVKENLQDINFFGVPKDAVAKIKQ